MTPLLKATLALTIGLISPAAAIKIDLRYHYDTDGFFEQPGAKEAMRACADFFEELIVDKLAAIDAEATGRPENSWAARPVHPSTGERLDIENLVVPENTLIIYLGARDLGGSSTGQASTGYRWGGSQPFPNIVISRGQEGALGNAISDYGPWGGSISFDTIKYNRQPREWNFSLTEPDGTRTGFVGVALHEICHILGIGLGICDSWKNLVVDGEFRGPATFKANGGSYPSVREGLDHWSYDAPNYTDSTVFGNFGNLHGSPQRALMVARFAPEFESLRTVTDLDVAALSDIGWEINPRGLPKPLQSIFNPPTGQVSYEVPTVSNFTYQLQRGTSLEEFFDLGEPLKGDGSIKTLTSPAYAEAKAFFRIVTKGPPSAARLLRPENRRFDEGIIHSDSAHCEVSCQCGAH